MFQYTDYSTHRVNLLWATLCFSLVACAEFRVVQTPIAPENEGVSLKGYYHGDHVRWPSLDISVCWENLDETDPDDRELVRRAIDESWGAAVPFNFHGWSQCLTNSTGIRILNVDRRAQSYVGTHIDGRPNGMWLNFFYERWNTVCNNSLQLRQACIRSTAIHEFGHALGLRHEQERPDTPDALEGYNCVSEVVPETDSGYMMLGGWDLHSIMNYCRPSYFAPLSIGDIKTIQTIYSSLMNIGADDHLEEPLLANGDISIRTFSGHYLVAERGGGSVVNADREEVGPWETFTVVTQADGRVAFRTSNGSFLSAEGGGGADLIANRDEIGDWERFEPIALGDERFALKTQTGHYVVALGGGGGAVNADRTDVGPWEQFTIRHHDDN
jgi:hypothetical protein